MVRRVVHYGRRSMEGGRSSRLVDAWCEHIGRRVATIGSRSPAPQAINERDRREGTKRCEPRWIREWVFGNPHGHRWRSALGGSVRPHESYAVVGVMDVVAEHHPPRHGDVYEQVLGELVGLASRKQGVGRLDPDASIPGGAMNTGSICAHGSAHLSGRRGRAAL